jgi:hypothetical protein
MSPDTNVVGKRAGQESERVTANQTSQSSVSSALIGRDPLAFLTRSLANYVRY